MVLCLHEDGSLNSHRLDLRQQILRKIRTVDGSFVRCREPLVVEGTRKREVPEMLVRINGACHR